MIKNRMDLLMIINNNGLFKKYRRSYYSYTIRKLEYNYNTVIQCKATDNSYNVQPEKLDLVWNIRGLNNNSWHKVYINKKTIPYWLFR